MVILCLDQHFGPLKLLPSVSLSVSLQQKFSYFLPQDFLAFLQEVRLLQVYKSDEARFLKKKCVSKLFSILSPKQGFLTVFCHFLENASSVLANFACHNRLEHSLQFLLRHHVRKKIRSPLSWPFCVQIRCFWHFFAIFLRSLHLFWPIQGGNF